MKIIRWNWVWTTWNWKIGNAKDSFYFNSFWWIETWWEINFLYKDEKSFTSNNYVLTFSIEDRWEYYLSCSHLRCHSEKAFKRFIRKRIKPIESKIKKWTIIELTWNYVWQQSLFYKTK